MTADEIRRRCEESCNDQGVPVLLDDRAVLARAAAIVRPHVNHPPYQHTRSVA